MGNRLRILIVEDVPTDAEMVERELGKAGFDFTSKCVDSQETLITALEEFHPDIVLSDFTMPKLSGLDALHIVNDNAPTIPFIIVTGSINEETAVKCIKAGAVDYLIKDHLIRIGPAVKAALEAKQLKSEREKLDMERNRLATAINQVADGVMVTDPEGVIQYVNPSFETISGYKRNEVIGKKPRILKSGNQDESFYTELWDTILAGHTWTGSITNTRKDSSDYDEEMTISPVFDETGEIVNFVAVKREVTDQLIMEKRLRVAQKMEALGTLAGGISHDFNNALTAITGFTQLVISNLPDDSQDSKDLQNVLAAANRSTDLVRQILTFSRQTEQEPELVQLASIIEESLRLLQPVIPATIKIETNIDPDCRLVFTDPTQMHQVIMNLCTNAYHAMKNTGGVLTLELGNVDTDAAFFNLHPGLKNEDYICLTVRDTGHGIEEGIMDRLFDPFFTTKDQNEGTGLGLSTAHGIVAAHQGTITVDSSPGEGAEFKIYLPCSVKSGEADSTLVPEVCSGQERILVVDDELSLAKYIEKILTPLGYTVKAIGGSKEALKEFRSRSEHFDLVITDLVMPGISGIELAEEISKIRPEIPIAMMTGSISVLPRQTAKAAGVNAFLAKPGDIVNIARHVRGILDSFGAKQHDEAMY